jgi:hypothetical protein
MQKQYVGIGVLVLVVIAAGWYFVSLNEPKAAPVVTPAPWKVVAHDFIEINGTQGVRYEFNSGYPAYDVNYVFLSNSKEYHVGLRLPLPERFPDNLTEEEIDLIKKDQINLFDQIVSTMEFPSR